MEEVWFVKVLVLLHLRSYRRSEEGGVAFIQHVEVTAHIRTVEKVLGGICGRWSTSRELDYSLDGKI